MGGLLCCCWRMFCCECACFEPKDNWTIDSEIRAGTGERGAGNLYKRAKNSAMWSKRYFVVTSNKLIYYLERDRSVKKGEIVLAGATAVVSSTRANTKKKFYFNVTHPSCGTRELYAKTNNRRTQWISKINEIANELQNKSAYGKLLKQGGLSKNIWQERWCVCTNETLDYFDAATDNQSKGSIIITNAQINPVKTKDKFCFEITASIPGKKGNKKYVFATETEGDRDMWVEVLRRNSTMASPRTLNGDDDAGDNTVRTSSASHASNPMHSTESMVDESDGVEMSVGSSKSNSTAVTLASTMLRGYLQKKSPSVFKGWQRRFFLVGSSGDIFYYSSEEESSNSNSEPKGVIRLKDVNVHNNGGVEVNHSTFEILVHLHTKTVPLKAASEEEATVWANYISNSAKNN